MSAPTPILHGIPKECAAFLVTAFAPYVCKEVIEAERCANESIPYVVPPMVIEVDWGCKIDALLILFITLFFIDSFILFFHPFFIIIFYYPYLHPFFSFFSDILSFLHLTISFLTDGHVTLNPLFQFQLSIFHRSLRFIHRLTQHITEHTLPRLPCQCIFFLFLPRI